VECKSLSSLCGNILAQLRPTVPVSTVGDYNDLESEVPSRSAANTSSIGSASEEITRGLRPQFKSVRLADFWWQLEAILKEDVQEVI
jgi:hypothetical protein